MNFIFNIKSPPCLDYRSLCFFSLISWHAEALYDINPFCVWYLWRRGWLQTRFTKWELISGRRVWEYNIIRLYYSGLMPFAPQGWLWSGNNDSTMKLDVVLFKALFTADPLQGFGKSSKQSINYWGILTLPGNRHFHRLYFPGVWSADLRILELTAAY